jgi:isopentenyl-diphosphate Delta-isomerase
MERDPANPSASSSANGEDVLILVDEQDRPVGFETKLAAHQNGGKLHRAFSVFIFNSRGQMLLQRRAAGKYHFGGLWTNACCSHPRRGEDTTAAAHARLRKEFGFDADLEELFSFVYRAQDPKSGLTEHECDHVFRGTFDGQPRPDPAEIGEWKWVEPAALLADVRARPAAYTPWFKEVVERVLRHPTP